jgi:hypothetical protein
VADSTKESHIKRDLRSPKYRMRVETDEKKEQKITGLEADLIIVDECIDLEVALCQHNYLSGCPFCKVT